MDPGLLEHRRKESGYRTYTAERVARVQFIRSAQHVGFTFSEIAGILRRWAEGHKPYAEVREGLCCPGGRASAQPSRRTGLPQPC